MKEESYFFHLHASYTYMNPLIYTLRAQKYGNIAPKNSFSKMVYKAV